MRIELLLAVVLIGCANSPEPKPMATKSEPPFVRVMTTKSDLVYNYKVHGDGPTGFELAEADAEKTCRIKWNLVAAQKTQVSCATYNSSAMVCAVAFECR